MQYCMLIVIGSFELILDTSVGEIEETFKTFVNRADVAIVLINQVVSMLENDTFVWAYIFIIIIYIYIYGWIVQYSCNIDTDFPNLVS